MPAPRIIEVATPERADGVAVIIHGGAERSRHRTWRLNPAVLRMIPIAHAIRDANPRTVVLRMITGVFGWNDDGAAALAEAGALLGSLRADRPGTPVVLVGHSMGGRTALRCAAIEPCVGAVALAPWTPPGEPVAHLAGQEVVVIQGDRDRTTPLAESDAYLAAAQAAGIDIDRRVLTGTGHTMLRRAPAWNALTAQAVRRILREV